MATTTTTTAPVILGRGRVPTAAPFRQQPLYGAPAHALTQVQSLTFSNVTGANITVRLWVVPANQPGAITDSHLYWVDVVILPGSDPTPAGDPGLVLLPGDMLYWQASGDGVNGYITGTEVSG